MRDAGRHALPTRCTERREGSRWRISVWPVAALTFVVLLVAAGAHAAWGQASILTFTVDPVALDITPGGSAHARVAVHNSSPYEADQVDFSWSGPQGFALDPAPGTVSVVEAYGSASVPFTLAAAADVPAMEVRGSLEAVYSYCIDESCFEIVESVPVLLRVVSHVQTPSAAAAGPTQSAAPKAFVIPWRWVAFGAVLVLLVPAGLVRASTRVRVLLFSLLAVAGAATLAAGVTLDQHRQAQAVGAVLCTSCVGIETTQTLTPKLSPAQAAAVDRLTQPIELVVFYAPWCRSCPYAEGLVDLVARRNPLVHYRLANAEVERDLAAQYGVTRAGRTVVPAIVRVDTGGALFGAEDLGDRLIVLLKEGT